MNNTCSKQTKGRNNAVSHKVRYSFLDYVTRRNCNGTPGKLNRTKITTTGQAYHYHKLREILRKEVRQRSFAQNATRWNESTKFALSNTEMLLNLYKITTEKVANFFTLAALRTSDPAK
jgi:hypothetical protein